MNINNFLTGVTYNITSKTQKKSITPTIIGGTFTELANITKEAVEANVYTFTNGLTSSGSTIKLGGALDANAELVIGDVNNYINTLNYSVAKGTSIGSKVGDYSVNFGGLSQSTSAGVGMEIKHLTSVSGLFINSTGLQVKDEILLKGLGDYADYSGNKTAYSYVTKQMLENALTGSTGSYTFNNGLTNTDGNVTLGGDYLEDITVGEGTNKGLLSLTPYKGYLGYTTDANYAYLNIMGGEVNMYYGEGFDSLTGFRISNTGIVVSDDNALKGMVYERDFSANFVPRSLVDKAYVDSVAGGSYTFENGLTLTGSTVSLGGTLVDGNTTIGDLEDLYIILSKSIDVPDDNTISVGVAGNSSKLTIDSFSTTLVRGGFGARQSIVLSDDSMKITDGKNQKGLEYNIDYSANFTARSLVDKAYVDSVAGGSYAFGNGLTLTGSTVSLGGNYSGLIEIGNQDIQGSIILFTDFSFFGYSGAGLNTSPTSVALSVTDSLTKQINISTTSGMIISDGDFKGLEEDADYSANKTAYSYVTLQMLEDYTNFSPIISRYASAITTDGTATEFEVPVSNFVGLTSFNSVIINARTFIPNYAVVTTIEETVTIYFETPPTAGTLFINMVGFNAGDN